MLRQFRATFLVIVALLVGICGNREVHGVVEIGGNRGK